MNKTRIYELAKTLKVTSKEIISKANALNIAVKSHSNSLNEDEVKLITDAFTIKPQIKNNTSATLKITLKDNEETSLEEHIQKAFNELRNIEDFVLLINKVNKTIYEHTHKVELKHLTYHAYHSKDKYQVFEIPKKSGGIREIYAPSKGLKYILKTMNVLFQALHKPQSVAHGFLPNRSVVTNAKLHVDKNYVFNIDLENFFPNIHQARVWKRLQYPPFNLNGKRIEIANLLSNLVCFQYEKGSNEKNFLPQGAPTSPILSNIICYRLDKKLFELAKKYNVKYTRYADDMTFSSDHNVYQDNSEFLQKLFSIIKSENFKINPKKTRLQKKGFKQEVTGLIVNEKINVSRSYIKNARALIHLVEKYGDEKAQKIFSQKNGSKSLDLVIFGKLQYLKMVKGSEDSTYKTLYQKAMDAYKMVEVEVTKSNNDEEKQTEIIKKNTINEKHNPKELVKILRNFTTCEKPPCALKAAVHSEEEYYQFDGYEDYMKNLDSAWKKINKPLKNLSTRLHGKIYAFLFAADLGTQERADKSKSKNSGWGDSGITFGWSSPQLKEWCLDVSKNPKGNNPFEYQLEEKHQKEINEKSITTFFDVCMHVFKHEIEVRSEINQLYKVFLEMKKSLNESFNTTVDKRLKGQDFYTDVQWLKGGIHAIFDEIKKRSQFNLVDIELKADTHEYIEVSIAQNGSESNKESKKLALEINDGDFKTISERFCSLCDWSIETKCLDGNYRVNFLRDKDIQEIEKLDYEPKGFTHILRFYK